MKKTNLYAKKTLSVFMAVMMLLSAWVFVPGEHNHASAVAASSVSSTNLNAVNSFTDASFNTSFTTVSGNFHGDNASTMASRGYYKNVLYSPHFPASNNNLNNSDAGVYFGTLGGTADGARVWYPETTIIWDGSTTPQIPILFDIDSNNNNRVGVKNVYISSGANGLVFKNSYWSAKSECGKDTNYYTHFTFDWIMQNNATNYWISTSSGNDKESMCSSKGYWDIYGTYLQYTGGSFGSGSTYYKAITPTWVCRTGSNYTGTTNKTIYVIDYVPLKNALNDMKTLINEVKANPAKYTTASVSALVAAANKLIAAKPNNYINSSSNQVVNWNSAVSSALSAYNSAKTLAVQQYTLTFKSINGTTKTYTYNYGTSINCYNLAPANSITLIDGNDTMHQTYAWDVSNMSITALVDDVTINEVPAKAVAHDFDSNGNGELDVNDYAQTAGGHSLTCSVCTYVLSEEHKDNNGRVTDEDTCEEAGTRVYDCVTCGRKNIRTESFDDIKGHDFRGDIVEKETGKDGNHWQKCTRCDVYGWGTTANACEDHNWDRNADGEVNAADAVVSEASTCENKGYEIYKCTVCEAEFTEILGLADHIIVKTEAKIVENICGGDGNEAFWSCTVCDRVWTDEAREDELTDTTDADNDNIPDILETKGPDHDFTSEKSPYVSVSRGADGEHYRKCSRCDAHGLVVNGVPIVDAKEAHNFGDPAVTPATCTKTGSEVYTCEDCGESYTVTLSKVAHKMTKTEAAVAECNKPGNKEYYTCNVCGGVYKDAEGTTATTPEKEAVAALTHTWDGHNSFDTEIKTPATCMTEAEYYNHCKYCGTRVTGTHFYGGVDLVNGHSFNGTTVKDNADGTHSYSCTVAGCTAYGNPSTCKYDVVKDVASTCKEFGYIEYKCKDCGNGYTVQKTEKDYTNHEGGTEVRFAVEAKCNTNGYTGDTYCLTCNTKIEQGEAIEADKTVHAHENMIDYEGQAATCQVKGWEAYRYCNACGTYEIAIKEIDTVAHTFTVYTSNGNGTHTANCDTCKAADGEIATETKACAGTAANCVDLAHCSVCDTDFGTTDSTNHKNIVTIEKSDSTCQIEGHEAYKHCDACGIDTETKVIIPVKAHTYGAWASNGDGTHSRICTACNTAKEDGTCDGGIAYCNAKAVCATCNTAYGEVDAANHKSEATYVTGAAEATCQAPGYTGDKYHSCCDALIEKGSEIEIKEHNYSIEVENSRVAATCTDEGEVTFKCSTCVESEGVSAATKKETLDKNPKNHASEETVKVKYKAATCESDGYTGDIYYVCCYDSTKTDAENKTALASKGTTIKANGQHVYGEAIPEYMIGKTEEPTYAEKVAARHADGKWYHVRVCTICSEAVTSACYTYEHTYNCVETDICELCSGLCSLLDAKKHKSELEVVSGKAATCTEDGVKDYYKCADCNNTYFDQAGKNELDLNDAEDKAALVISKATAAHNFNYDGEPTETVAATCVEDGYKLYTCTEGCGTTTKVITSSSNGQHEWKTEYEIVDEPTCGENGYKGIRCSVCDSVKPGSYVSIAATGEHTYKETGRTGGTNCKDPIIVTMECEVCGDKTTETVYDGDSEHKWSDWVAKGGDCATGVVQVRSCTVCGVQEQRTVSAGMHDLEIKIQVDPTCEADGYIIRVCKNCGFEEEKEVLPRDTTIEGHDFNKDEYKTVEKATCETAEQRQYTCIHCGEKVIYTVGEKLDHVWLSQPAEVSTCLREGHNEYYRCVRCEAEVGRENYAKLDHVDADNNGKCDECSGVFYEGGTKQCTCMCHKDSGLMKIIYKIISFFWRLFKINGTCACGAAHY